jgi:hypothetical protein
MSGNGPLRYATLAALLANLIAAASTQAAEFAPPFPKTFSGGSSEAIFKSTGGTKISCTAEIVTGEVTGPEEGSARASFTGCVLNGSSTCQSRASRAGFIESEELEVLVGGGEHSEEEGRFDLSSKFDAPWAEFACLNLKAEIRGSVVGAITPVGRVVKKGKHYSVHLHQTKGVEKTPYISPRGDDVLGFSANGGLFEGMGLTSPTHLFFAEETKLVI